MYSCLGFTTFCALKSKEVICLKDGKRLGYPSDLEINLCNFEVEALLLPDDGFFSFSNKNRYRVEKNQIEKIGEDFILVCDYENLKNQGCKEKCC